MPEPSSDSEPIAEERARKQRIKRLRPDQKFKRGDIVLTKQQKFEKNGKRYRAVVELGKQCWAQHMKGWKWSYKIGSESGERFIFWSPESNLEKLDIVPGDEVKSHFHHQEVTGVVDRVFVDDDNQVAYDVRYNARAILKEDQLTKP